MKKLFTLFPLICLPLFSAQPNVPLYVRWDGTIAAPTQFLNATFKAGANITLTDNRTNLTIAAAVGTGSNSVVIVPGSGISITTNITGTNISYTISSTGGTNIVLTNTVLNGWTNVSQIVWFTNAIAETDSNIFIAFSNGPIQWLEYTNTWLFIHTTNREFEASGNHINVELWLKPKTFAIDRSVALDTNWHRFSGSATNLQLSNKLAILRIRKTGPNETDMMISWEPEIQ